MGSRNILFSPPDIREEDIRQVAEVLRSGWITTGEKTRSFETRLSAYCGSGETLCVSSATAALELTLRLLGIGPGDEVITSAYTYTATASAALHTGADIRLADTSPGSCVPDPRTVLRMVNCRTKAIIGVDIGGIPWDYGSMRRLLEREKRRSFDSPILRELGRPAVIADAAHSLGAVREGNRSGTLADFTCFSFHAVKNLTTGEGGAVTWRTGLGDDARIHQKLRRLSLHGQSRNAYEKLHTGGWEYDILEPAYKCNMTDMAAALGLSQLDRYEELLARRRNLALRYNQRLNSYMLPLQTDEAIPDSACHLYIVRLPGKTQVQRDEIIRRLWDKGIASNVHYKPLPMMTAYRRLGFVPGDFPQACGYYQNQLTLPLHTGMSEEDVDYVCQKLIALL